MRYDLSGRYEKKSTADQKKMAAIYKAMPRQTARKTYGANTRSGGFMGIENKFYDTSLINSSLGSPTDASGGEHNPSATICLNSVVQGDGESERDGRQIHMNHISIQGTVKCNPQADQTAGSEPTICMIALVLDTQTNGALLNSEDVFVNPGANAQTAAQPFRNLQYTKRFKVIKKVMVHFDAPAYATYDGTNIESGGQTRAFEIHAPLNIVTQYKGTTETIANIVDNSLNIVAFCSNTEQGPDLYYNARLRFTG